MIKTAHIILETDNTGFTFVKNHDELPYWLVDKVESEMPTDKKPDPGVINSIGSILYRSDNETIVSKLYI